MPEAATSQRLEAPTGAGLAPWLRKRPLAAGFAILALLLGAYGASLAVCGAPRPLLRADAPFGLDVVFRMNLVLAVLIAYTIAVGLMELRVAPREAGRLRALLDCDDATFEAAFRASIPSRGRAAAAFGLGALFGLAISVASHTLIAGIGNGWEMDFHERWNAVSVMLLFALLGAGAFWGIRGARLYSSLSRRYARVVLLDPQPQQLFAARGLRLALVWFLGSGIALLLAPKAQAQGVVLVSIGATFAVGVASLVLPSLGIHQRMREAKAAELARVREEIGTRLAALRGGDSEGAVELPALLAWESRVAEVPEWPLGGAVLARFTLLVLIPLGSWLGGALVERLVDGVLG